VDLELVAPTIDKQSELFPEDLKMTGGRKQVLVMKNPA